MSKVITYNITNEGFNNINFGKVHFNGKFVFELDDKFTVEQWNSIGFIHLDSEDKKVESNNLFAYLNSRLPIHLRDKEIFEKLNYIDRTGLRVASDSFVLVRQ